ncbi:MULTISPECIES: PTS sugar transporter subunit IIB [Lactiplantibacillus]|jgi:PTS system ascorbate-specific IIB component|uniref:PTS sugar transporter subunit IIB n=1 Tax=Lactiplantibacillus pentosus TaxID=1589 RepID=A0AAW8VVY8_LACPE|nr:MULTISPECIES: PTS sugar transporter subunit IIB [Lactiplantibacillus]MBU7449512.1 PTS sugar transporter subunit IIB [Lactiplantibacillus sp. 7.2.4]MBU7473643.1 PTS sugar transporter subunit IIB [Lactiplantibacillus pentosus]MBU7481008.1 PTS sugar transporter subunit IIB [Lactiplantibacillus pentosus]MBU7528481.1 PTS sugar transporter subunit IIB [Lactiplantibacillus pentosus]MCB5220087.1 PTS sugar transporter subunit IIB [Lactiplantibacillus pentosus]
MIKALVACRAGVGSSLMLKIKLNEVISEHSLPVTIEHSSLDGVPSFDGPIIIALSDVAQDLQNEGIKKEIIGITNIMDKNEIYSKLSEAVSKVGA